MLQPDLVCGCLSGVFGLGFRQRLGSQLVVNDRAFLAQNGNSLLASGIPCTSGYLPLSTITPAAPEGPFNLMR